MNIFVSFKYTEHHQLQQYSEHTTGKTVRIFKCPKFTAFKFNQVFMFWT